MFEKVNPQHPDKLADRIAGAIVDLAYAVERNPRIAVEVLIGHGKAFVIIETSLGRHDLTADDVAHAVRRICPYIDSSNIHITIASQDVHLADNQSQGLHCGDNGIFRGMPVTTEQRILTSIAATIHANFPTDGKYIIDMHHNDADGLPECTVCQSNAQQTELEECLDQWDNHHIDSVDGFIHFTINPLGFWTGGTNVDCGATNRKLGSDMGDAVTGGGLHGKDLSKADVSVNIVCHILAQQHRRPVEASCAIGDSEVTFHFPGQGDRFPDNLPTQPDITLPFPDIVELARLYILTDCAGSFERLAEWGLIRPQEVRADLQSDR